MKEVSGLKTQQRDFKKQEFKDILEHISNLEEKVELLLERTSQNLVSGNAAQESSSDESSDSDESVQTESLTVSSPSPPTIQERLNAPVNNINSSKTSVASPLFLLADAITSSMESAAKRDSAGLYISNDVSPEGQINKKVRIDESSTSHYHLPTGVNKISKPTPDWPKNDTGDTETGTFLPNIASMSYSLQNESPFTASPINHFFRPVNTNIDYVWSNIRSALPLELQTKFDSLDLTKIAENDKKQEIIQRMIDSPKIREIPSIEIMNEFIKIFIKVFKYHVIVPIEDYDLLGILKKWKNEGYDSLNQSHLLLLNVSALMVSKALQNILESKLDKNHKRQNLLDGIVNKELVNLEWLQNIEDLFLGNSLLYCQSIALFPDGLASVQGILTFLIYLPMIGVNLAKSLMLSTAVRIAQDLGLHSEFFSNAIQNTSRLREKKRKVWWFCCFSDQIISKGSLKPCMILKYNTTVEFKSRGKPALLNLPFVSDDNADHITDKKQHQKLTKKYDHRDDLVKYIYETEGIGTIVQHYLFEFSNILFKHSAILEKNFSVEIFRDMKKECTDFFENLPKSVRENESIDKVFNADGQEDGLFIYMIHLFVMGILTHCNQVLAAICDGDSDDNNIKNENSGKEIENEKKKKKKKEEEKETLKNLTSLSNVEFLRKVLKKLLKANSLMKWALFKEKDLSYFVPLINIVEHDIKNEKDSEKIMEDYFFLKKFIIEFHELDEHDYELFAIGDFGISNSNQQNNQGNSSSSNSNSNSNSNSRKDSTTSGQNNSSNNVNVNNVFEDNSLIIKGHWKRNKFKLVKQLLEIMKEFAESKIKASSS